MNKRKIFTLALTVCMIAILAVGGTLAYMFDTDHQVNVFTAGKVGINLDEAKVVQDDKDNWVAYGNERIDAEVKDDDDITQTYDLHPNMTVFKDPTITVDDDSNPCYLGAKITITGDLYDLIGVKPYENIDITKLASGGLIADAATQVQNWNKIGMAYETDKCVIYQDADQDAKTWVLYIFLKDVYTENQKVVLFDTLTIPADYDNEKMAMLNGMKIDVKAFGVQAAGFEYLDKDMQEGDQYEACFVAMTEAFGGEDGEWNFPNSFVDGQSATNPNAGNLRVKKQA